MKKKILSLGVVAILIIMLVSLTGCGKSNENANVEKQEKEVAEEKSDISVQNNLNNNETKTESGKSTENLSDVVQVGDYVRYLESDTNWRVINIVENSKGTKTVYLIYSSYIEDNYNSSSYESVLARLKSTEAYVPYLDSKYATEVLTTVPRYILEGALANYYETIPDLFDVGENISVGGEVTINYSEKRLAVYKNGSNEITGAIGYNKKIRPTIALKENIKTTGKNEKGAWELYSEEVDSSTSDFTPRTESEAMPDNTDYYKYFGNYEWKSGNDTIKFELQEEDGGTVKYYILYYPSNSVHASEDLYGLWGMSSDTIDTTNNGGPNYLANYTISNIKYREGEIEFTIKRKDIRYSEYFNYVIPDGTYTFKKQ